MEGVVQLRSTSVRSDQGVLADEIKLGDQVGHWQTEAVHESIKKRLKLFGNRIKDGAWQQLDGELCTEQFVCSILRPNNAHLEEVFDDSNLTVFRPSPAFQSDLAQADSLSAAIRGLAAPFASSRCEIHFKVFKITLDGQFAESEMYVDTDGAGQSDRVQQNMVWICRWQRIGRDDWKFASIRLTQFEEVHYQAPTGKLFADCTRSVLSANPCFEPHLMRGIDYWRLRFEERFGIDSVSLAGLAIGDVNGDGLDDFYYCDVGGLPNRLFVQQRDGTAKDVSAQTGVDWLDRGHGAFVLGYGQRW